MPCHLVGLPVEKCQNAICGSDVTVPALPAENLLAGQVGVYFQDTGGFAVTAKIQHKSGKNLVTNDSLSLGRRDSGCVVRGIRLTSK
jgi:hypothetical protein